MGCESRAGDEQNSWLAGGRWHMKWKCPRVGQSCLLSSSGTREIEVSNFQVLVGMSSKELGAGVIQAYYVRCALGVYWYVLLNDVLGVWGLRHRFTHLSRVSVKPKECRSRLRICPLQRKEWIFSNAVIDLLFMIKIIIITITTLPRIIAVNDVLAALLSF